MSSLINKILSESIDDFEDEITHYLVNQLNKKIIYKTTRFNQIELNKIIKSHLVNKPYDSLDLYLKNHYSNIDTYLATYSNNPKTNKPSKVVLQGARTFYKEL